VTLQGHDVRDAANCCSEKSLASYARFSLLVLLSAEVGETWSGPAESPRDRRRSYSPVPVKGDVGEGLWCVTAIVIMGRVLMCNVLVVIVLAVVASCGNVSMPASVSDGGDSTDGNSTDARVPTRSITAVSGDGQSGAAGGELAAPFVVAVADDGQPVVGAQVNFRVVAGNGSMSQTVVTTDAAGHAASTLTLGKELGRNTVQAELVGTSLAPVVFEALSQPGSARRIALSSGNLQRVRFGVETAPLVVTVLDAEDNPVSGYSVTFRVTAGGGSLPAATAVTGDDGRASIRWIVGGPVANTVEASGAGVLDSPVVFSANVSAFRNVQTFNQGSGTLAVTAGDLNADGKLDLVLATTSTTGAASTIVLRNTSTASAISFSSAGSPTVANRPISVVSGDLNGDGRPDLVFGYFDLSTLSVFLNTTTAGSTSLTWSAESLPSVGFSQFPFTLPMAMADINGDGKLDVVTIATGDGSSPRLAVLRNTTTAGATTPSFASSVFVATDPCGRNGTPTSLAMGDINGDGRPDAVIACGDETGAANGVVSVFLNSTPTGSAPTFVGAQSIPSGRRERLFAAIGDINGDGKPDIVAANGIAHTASVVLNTTTMGGLLTTFSEKVEFSTGRSTLVIVADLNGDGRPDIAVGNKGIPLLSVLANTTPAGAAVPTFASNLDLPLAADPEALTSADLNGDGLPDLIAVSKTTVSVFAGE
jgi:hypothetical protein